MSDALNIKIPVFEGPFDLLLHLIKENKIDIYDIPISLITGQYLEYLKLLKELDLEIAGDFIVMASTLIHIKSRMLLPIEAVADTDEPEDPRLELVQKLLEYRAFKDAALELQEREDEWQDISGRPDFFGEGVARESGDELPLFDLNIFDLMSAFKKLLERAPAEALTITKESLTVKDRLTHIIDLLERKDAMRFEELFEGAVTKERLVVTFIALLETLRLGLARVYQEREFSTIWVIGKDAEVPESLRPKPEEPIAVMTVEKTRPEGYEAIEEHEVFLLEADFDVVTPDEVLSSQPRPERPAADAAGIEAASALECSDSSETSPPESDGDDESDADESGDAA